MHLTAGDISRLVTLHTNPLGFPEDICLGFPLPVSPIAKLWRRKKVQDTIQVNTSLPVFRAKNFAEKIYFSINDFLRTGKVNDTIEEYGLNDYDIIHYDGGLDFYRYPSQAIAWKKGGKKIVCCYYGSDLRQRGIIKELDAISDLNITSEYDHLALKPDLHYVFYPYDPSELPPRAPANSKKIRIVHSPTNRIYKGTDLILRVINRIEKELPVEFVLLENLPRKQVLNIKSTCDISIDQVGGSLGGTGYGKAGLETLAMGIPTITNMHNGYASWIPENPFCVANNEESLYATLSELILNEKYREELGRKGKDWVHKYHGYASVDKRLKTLYKEYHITE